MWWGVSIHRQGSSREGGQPQGHCSPCLGLGPLTPPPASAFPSCFQDLPCCVLVSMTLCLSFSSVT